MTTIALLPLRSLRDGKQRLRDVLSPQARTELVQTLFVRALNALCDANCIAEVVVVSPDAELLTWVQQHNVWSLLQPNQGLNHGLEHARRVVLAQRQVSSLLVMLPDLPLVQPQHVAELVALGEEQSVVIAADRHERGTNALLLRPPDTLRFAFGEGSRQLHLAAASERGLSVLHYRSSGTAHDLDTPDDLELAGLSNESLCVC
jgi:2-phospho-L-lactate guanylyltransferase